MGGEGDGVMGDLDLDLISGIILRRGYRNTLLEVAAVAKAGNFLQEGGLVVYPQRIRQTFPGGQVVGMIEDAEEVVSTALEVKDAVILVGDLSGGPAA